VDIGSFVTVVFFDQSPGANVANVHELMNRWSAGMNNFYCFISLVW